MGSAGTEDTSLDEHPVDEHPALEVLPHWPQETIGMLVTTEPSGTPHVIPVSWPVRADDRRVLLSLRYNRGSLSRLRAQPHVALLILGGGDVAISARGTARVVLEQMPGAPEYAAVAIEVTVIEDHRQGAFEVATGVQRTVLDESELRYLADRVQTLRSLG